MIQIINKFIKETNDLLSDKQIEIVLTQKAIDYFISETIGKNLGARPLHGIISTKVKSPLSKMILFGEIEKNSKFLVDFKNNEFVFKVKTQPIADDQFELV